MQIERIGSYQVVDAQGRLIKLAALSKLQPDWLAPLDCVSRAYRERLGGTLHSAYVRGSVARGEAIREVSDLDSFAVVLGDPVVASESRAWAHRTEGALLAQFPYVTGVELRLVAFEDAAQARTLDAFIIKNEAVCVHGEDLAERISPFRIGAEIAFEARAFGRHLSLFAERHATVEGESRRELLVWITRHMLRLGMELVMTAEQRYTRDLYLCYESFSRYHPEWQDAMYRVLSLAVNPQPSPDSDMFVLQFAQWLKSTSQEWLCSRAEQG